MIDNIDMNQNKPGLNIVKSNFFKIINFKPEMIDGSPSIDSGMVTPKPGAA